MQFPSYLFSENAPRKTQVTLILNFFWMSSHLRRSIFTSRSYTFKISRYAPGLKEDLNLSKKSE